jgi:hypothetical protein
MDRQRYYFTQQLTRAEFGRNVLLILTVVTQSGGAAAQARLSSHAGSGGFHPEDRELAKGRRSDAGLQNVRTLSRRRLLPDSVQRTTFVSLSCTRNFSANRYSFPVIEYPSQAAPDWLKAMKAGS